MGLGLGLGLGLWKLGGLSQFGWTKDWDGDGEQSILSSGSDSEAEPWVSWMELVEVICMESVGVMSRVKRD